MTEDRLKEIEKLIDAATVGPWKTEGEGIRTILRGFDSTIVATRHLLPAALHQSNFECIAAIHSAIPELIAEVRRLREQVKSNARIIQSFREHLARLSLISHNMARKALEGK